MKKNRKIGVNHYLTSNISMIKNTELAYTIGAYLKNESLTAKELIDKISGDSAVSVDFLAISIGECINDLINSQLILKDITHDEFYYKASDSFKQLLGDG